MDDSRRNFLGTVNKSGCNAVGYMLRRPGVDGFSLLENVKGMGHREAFRYVADGLFDMVKPRAPAGRRPHHGNAQAIGQHAQIHVDMAPACFIEQIDA